MTDIRPDWLPTAEFPFDVKTITLPTGRLTYIDQGTGPTLLFVHTGMWSFIFRDVIQRLQSDYRCIAMDFPGYGLNADQQSVLSIRDQSRLLGEFVDELGLERITIVAHDLGGPVAAAMAAAQPGQIAGMVLSNTFTWTPDSRALRLMFRVMSSRTITAVDTATNLVPKMTSTRAGVGRHLDRAGRDAFLGPFHDRSVRRNFHLAMRSTWKDPDFTDSVADAVATTLNHIPVLTIFGEKNDPFGFQDRHAATFPDHEGLVVVGSNHFPMMDEPELFVTTLEDWHSRKVGAGKDRVPPVARHS